MVPSGSSTWGGAGVDGNGVRLLSRWMCLWAIQWAGPELPVSDIIVGVDFDFDVIVVFNKAIAFSILFFLVILTLASTNTLSTRARHT